MTAIGKLLALLNLVAGLGILAWSVTIYVERPGWFDKAPDGVDKGNSPVGFEQLKAETDALGRAAGVASAAWGTHLQTLEEREKYRADRRKAFDDRRRWAYKGHPNDKVDPVNPKSPGKGFYEPVIDPASKLYDLSVDAKGIPKGKAVVGTDGVPLPGVEGLAGSISGDTAEIAKLTEETIAQRAELNKLNAQVVAVEVRLLKMGEIRDSVQAELFFLSTFEVNVFETRETVLRREKQLRRSLRTLGITDP
jgi:hypothetical protein